MDGVLVVDKPSGPTSHDVVACARRVLLERRIGHTGTLDPLATGVLPLACGRATRLVRFLTASDKDYEATIRFGITTDSYDITGTETSRSGAIPTQSELIRGLASLTGPHLQTPPAYSAKKIGGRRAYALARQQVAAVLAPVRVTLSRAELLDVEDDRARVALTCSAGFYVRAFAHMLGQQLGVGACLQALRRTRSGDFGLECAVSFHELAQGGPGVLERFIPLRRLLSGFPAAQVTDEGRSRISHGRQLDAQHFALPAPQDPADGEPVVRERNYTATEWVRLLDSEGSLLALGTPGMAPGSLHPSVVLI